MIDVVPLASVMAYAADIPLTKSIDSSKQKNLKMTLALLAQGWAYCNGQEIDKLQYSSLYQVIGDIYGESSSNDVFCLPDYRGYFFRAVENGADINSSANSDRIKAHKGIVGGVGSTQIDTFQGHEHQYKGGVSADAVPAQSGIDSVALKTLDTHKIIPEKDMGEPRSGEETRPINIAVNYIIKIRTFGPPLDVLF